MEKRIVQLAIAFFVLWGVWNLIDPFWTYDLNEAVDSGSTEKIVFNVSKGESGKNIAVNLEDEGLISNSHAFVRTVKNEDLDTKLRYGKFVLSPGMTIREIITILTTTGTGEMALTVKEGDTIRDIDAELTNIGLIQAGEFTLCTFNCKFDYDFLAGDGGLEGFLFPDTYFLDSGNFSSEVLINQMLANFDKKFTDQMQATAIKNARSIRDIINVAAMLEKEVNYVSHPKDTPLVSGIIWKRLDNNWTLGIDATLLYLDADGELSADDLASNNPYNSRKVKGLPPTAVDNPGIATIEAALYPETSIYWFYLTDPESGDTIFAVTNEEHEANKDKYL